MTAPDLFSVIANGLFWLSYPALIGFWTRSLFARGTRQWVLGNAIWQEFKPLYRGSNVAQLLDACVQHRHWWSPGLWLLNLLMWELIIVNDKDDDDRWGKRRKKFKARLRVSIRVLQPSPSHI